MYPKGALVFVELPFAVGEYDGMEFQSFRFVYGHRLNTLGGSCRDGRMVQLIVPIGKQLVDVASRLATVGEQSVKECHYISGFMGECFEVEDTV